jgi:serine protease Do/2-alkenal reductase
MKILFKSLAALLLVVGGTARAQPMPPALADLAARVLPSVVSVASTDPVSDDSDSGSGDDDGQDNSGPDDQGSFRPDRASDTTNAAGTVLPPPKAEEALGSGFIFDPAGYILTNNHVIAGASSVSVTFQDGTILPATVVGRDKDGDLAVLKVDAGHPLPALKFGDSAKLRVGDWVLAIGNPFGLAGSASAGIVSALHRNIDEDKYDDFIQTDATINRGNSGGPLFDLTGHVIGVNAAIYSPSGGSVGIGFAIPSDMAEPVAAALVRTGSFERGWLGIATQEVTPAIAGLLGLPSANGALIGGTSANGPAAGKLQPGDVLVSLGHGDVDDPRTLMIRTAEIPVGQATDATFWRDGRLQDVTLTVAAPPPKLDDTEAPAPVPAPNNLALPDLGIAVAGVATETGITVVAVTPKGGGAAAGLVADNVIEQLDGAPVGTPDDLRNAVNHLVAAHQPVAVLLVSGDAADGSDPGPRWVPVSLKQ